MVGFPTVIYAPRILDNRNLLPPQKPPRYHREFDRWEHFKQCLVSLEDRNPPLPQNSHRRHQLAFVPDQKCR